MGERMQEFEFYSPKTISEALEYLADKGSKCKILAGGTDVVPALRSEEVRPSYVMNILEIGDLRGVSDEKDSIRIGPATTFTEIAESRILKEHLPLLVEAASQVGAPPIRNRGTLGGNIGNASPAADVLPAVIALNGDLELQSKSSGIRVLPAGRVVQAAYKTCFGPDELMTGIVIKKLPAGTRCAFYKLGRRNAMARSYMSLSVALSAGKDGIVSDVRIVPGALEAVARRVTAAEKVLLGEKARPSLMAKTAEALAGDLVGVWIPEYKMPVLIDVFKHVLEGVL
jgi:CO/xanthine dehydrogenase FAD-binding subunit